MEHIKQLDSIRTVAVALVIITHWLPPAHPLNVYTSIFNGVDIFFTLSGFLITRILLENRIEAAKTGTPTAAVIRNFYIRRCLRIFPIYYLTIFLLMIAGPSTGTSIRSSFVYFLTYTSNFYFFNLQHWDGMLSHLWSLAVEEQFYLLWPWLMLIVNKRFLLPVILTFIFIGISTQLYFMNVHQGDILTFCCFDGFGLGALLAWTAVFHPLLLRKTYPVWLCVAIIGMVLQTVRVATGSNFVLLPSRTLTSFCTVWLIVGILINTKKKSLFFTSFLGLRPLVYIGKISYGIYLYHLILPYVTTIPLTRLNALLPARLFHYNFYLVTIENFCLLIILSTASWQLIEKRFLRWKRTFGYQRVAPALNMSELAPDR